MEKKEVKQEEVKERFELVEITTQTGLAIKDNSNETILDTNQLLIKIANDIEKLKKGLVGND